MILVLAFSCPALVAQLPASGQTGDTASIMSKGQQISSAVATVTSTAVSPLMGVCVLGVWEHYRTPKVRRAKLPLYTQPYFWIPVGILLVLILLKDTVGGLTPLVKKPLDAIEVLMLNKASLILVVFPALIHQVTRLTGTQSPGDSLASLSAYVQPVVYAAGSEGSAVHRVGHLGLTAVLLAVGFATATAVWMVGHAFDVLGLLSPFPFFDLLLKGFRNAIFFALVVAAALNWKVGLGLSLVAIVLSFALAGWALRLLVFGAVFSWDLLRVLVLEQRRRPSPDKPILAFAASGLKTVRRRTYGRLSRNSEGGLVFHYRRFSLGPRNGLPLGKAAEYEVGKGLFYPSIVHPKAVAGRSEYRLIFRLLPGYLGSEGAVQTCLGLASIRDIRFPKGWLSFWQSLAGKTDEAHPATS